MKNNQIIHTLKLLMKNPIFIAVYILCSTLFLLNFIDIFVEIPFYTFTVFDNEFIESYYFILKEKIEIFQVIFLFLSLFSFYLYDIWKCKEIYQSIGRKNYVISHVLSLILLLILECFIIFELGVYACTLHADINFRKDFILQLTLYIGANYFLTGVFMILVGYCINQFRNVILKLISALFTCYIFLNYGIAELDFNLSQNLDYFSYKKISHVLSIFTITDPTLKELWISPFTGILVQPHQLLCLIFWISIVLLILYCSIKQSFYNKKTMTGLILIILFMITLLVMPYEEISSSYYGDGGHNYTTIHYDENKERIEQDITECKVYDIGFAVNNYNIEFEMKNQLKAKVKMDISESKLDTYCFTLYHQYNVASINDQNGKKLAYDRQGDYIIVYTNEENNISNIEINYFGNATGFYSQYQAVNLLSGIPFYQMPGIQNVYDYSEDVPDVFHNFLNEKANFEVKVKSGLELFSNLEKVEPNHFVGEDDTLILVGGLYQKIIKDDVTFVVPKINLGLSYSGFNSYDEIIEYADLMYKKSGFEEFNLHNKTIFTVRSYKWGAVYNKHGVFEGATRVYDFDYMYSTLELEKEE